MVPSVIRVTHKIHAVIGGKLAMNMAKYCDAAVRVRRSERSCLKTRLAAVVSLHLTVLLQYGPKQ